MTSTYQSPLVGLADLLFHLFGLEQTSKSVVNLIKTV